MWRKRRRYMFRKRSTFGPIVRLVTGVLVVLALLWLMPWRILSSEDVGDSPKVETVEALRVIEVFEAPEVVEVSKGQPEQETVVGEQPKAANPPPAQPPPAQPPTSLPPPVPAPSRVAPAPPRVAEVPQSFLPAPNDYYWGYGSNNYWYYEPWGNEPDYYWSY